jgi:hypothetical protein
MNRLAIIKKICRVSALTVLTLMTVTFSAGGQALAATYNSCKDTSKPCCGGGSGEDQIVTSIDLGCKGKGNPILDMVFAFIRFLTAGAGLIMIGSMIWAGIQYAGSRGDPSATAKAIGRIRANVFALLLFIFAFAMLDYVIPGAFLKP